MKVFPVINCPDLKCVLKKLAQIHDVPVHMVHIDVSDGIFTKSRTWNSPEDLRMIKKEWPELNFEVHLMVQNPQSVLEDWVKAGASRVVVHFEAISAAALERHSKMAGKFGGEIGISVKPNTLVEKLFPVVKDFDFVQLLAVEPGPSGQKFDDWVLEKIKFLKKFAPKVKIEIDGGMNLKTARLVKKAGADVIVSDSYIFGHHHPKKAYQEISRI